MEEIIYLNGQLIPRSEAKLSPFDHGFLYGYGLFETMRAYNGCIFRLDRHLDRLYRSAEILGLAHNLIAVSRSPGAFASCDYKSFDSCDSESFTSCHSEGAKRPKNLSQDKLREEEAKQSLETACVETLKANKLKDARLRLTISAGEGDMTPDPGTCSNPTILVTARNLIPLPPEKYEQGFKAELSSLRCDSQSPLSRLKTTCYVNNVLARMEAKAAGYDEAVLRNEKGYLAEGSTSNIFLVSKGMLITPSLESGILPGITRGAVLEIAQALNIKVVEKDVELTELTEAEEAFITNSILEIMPLTWFDGKPVDASKAGQLTGKLIAAYKELVSEEMNGISRT